MCGFLRQPASNRKRERRNCRDRVVLLAGRKSKEADNHHRPDCEQKVGLLHRGKCSAQLLSAPGYRLQALREKRQPRRYPKQCEAPENQQRDGVVTWWNSLSKIAIELLVN